MASYIHKTIGPRTARGKIDVSEYIDQGKEIISSRETLEYPAANSIQEIKSHFFSQSRVYYTLCAVSRRTSLAPETRADVLSFLFDLRTVIEGRLLQVVQKSFSNDAIRKEAFKRTFFGSSIKQGVSIRYPLKSCVPTRMCGGRCYAHDGRDRELALIFRGVLNYCVGLEYETGGMKRRDRVIAELDKVIDYGISRAIDDQRNSMAHGFTRGPRIRFSHIGEMASTPDFTNRLAQVIRERNINIDCIVYTRHPDAAKLDESLFTINFTLESDGDNRRRFAPVHSRIVSSSWNGELSKDASINFLEHHVEKHSKPRGEGVVCPVTLAPSDNRSCDEAKCDLCFVKPEFI